MTRAATGGARAGAELLDPERDRAGEPGETDAGYLDLLGDDARVAPATTQDLMLTRVVPAIYERWWRPALARVAKGLTGPGMAEEIRIARLLMGLESGDRVLDVACGPGNFSRAFARAVGAEGLVGRDRRLGDDAEPRRSPISSAPSARNLALIRGDATDLPFEDGSFDAVCCFAALHLFANPFAALDDMRRVLAAGGRIAIMTSVRRQLMAAPLKPLVERASGMRLFEGDEIIGALEQRGFAGIHQRLAGTVQFVGGRLAA